MCWSFCTFYHKLLFYQDFNSLVATAGMNYFLAVPIFCLWLLWKPFVRHFFWMKLIISMGKALSVLINNFMCINTFVKIQTLTKLFIIHNIQCSIRNAIICSNVWWEMSHFDSTAIIVQTYISHTIKQYHSMCVFTMWISMGLIECCYCHSVT